MDFGEYCLGTRDVTIRVYGLLHGRNHELFCLLNKHLTGHVFATAVVSFNIPESGLFADFVN